MNSILTQTQDAIIQLLLANPEKHFSIRQIARALKKSYTLTYNNIQPLLKKDILIAEAVPPAQLIHISGNAPPPILIDNERKRADAFVKTHTHTRLYLHDVLKESVPFFIMLVFGSYAKGTQTKNSDIDILFIVPEKKDIHEIEKAAQQYTKIKKGIIVVDTKSFKEMIAKQNELNVGNEAQKHHVILYGAEQYYQIIK